MSTNGHAITNNNTETKLPLDDVTSSDIPRTDGDALTPAAELRTWRREDPVKLRLEPSGPLSIKPVTVMTLLQNTVKQIPDNIALAVKKNGQWVKWTYQQYYDDIRTVAKGFLKLGLEPMKAIGILGFNSPEWFLAEMGAIFAGGLAMGIYTTNSPEACHYVLDNSDANIVVVENDQQLQKILKVRDRLPHLKAIIQWDGKLKEKYEGCYSWFELVAMGREEDERALEERISNQSPNKCCTVVYTSGTTGNPKGVMLSHDNLTWASRTSVEDVKLTSNFGKQCWVSYLPLSHVAALMADLYNAIVAGATVYFAQPDALKGTLLDTIKEVRPTAFFGVPRVWEKIMEKMREVGKNGSFLKQKIGAWAKSVGYRGSISKMNRGSLPWGWSIANILVFKNVKAALGLDRCVLFLTGGAPLPEEVCNYFLSLDIPLMEVFGMTESTGPHTVSVPWNFRAMTLGMETSGARTKFVPPVTDGSGEICIYGRHVCMGYLDDEEKTKETLDEEGWLHSGDLGKKDKDGFLQNTGRIKEIIITAGGENIAPVPIEDRVKEELPVVSNCMLIGDRRKFLSILITLKTEVNPETTEPLDELSKPAVDWCRSHGSSVTTVTQVLETKEENVMRALQEGIDRANSRALSRPQNIQKWSILPRDFSIYGGELGPTLKTKRRIVCEQYKDTIDAFYDDV